MGLLIDDVAVDCVILDKTTVSDGLGGFTRVWVEGATFKAAFEYNASTEMLIAEKQGTERSYRIYIDKTLSLEYHDVFRRIEDGQVFRVTNDGTDRLTPPISTLGKRLIEVEKWVLT